jgi:peptidoglycan/LPS O-acetylase OafA/YrhL
MNLKKLTYIPVLDTLRAIAALSVCFYHFVIGPIDFIDDSATLTIFSYGKYGVQFFFVISGFVIPLSMFRNSYSISNYFTFLLKRFIRLEPPYLISILVFLALIFIRNHFSGFDHPRFQGANQLFFHIGYLIPFTYYEWLLDIYWTLAIEFQFYLLIAIYYFALISKKMFIRILWYILMIISAQFGGSEFLPYWLPLFLLGNLLFLYKNSFIKNIEFYLVSIFTLLYIAAFISLPVFFASILPFFAILYYSDFQNKILGWIGKVSYSVYLFHTVIGTAVVNLLSHYCVNNLQRFFVVIIGVATSIIFSKLIYKIIEEPSQKVSSRIKYKTLSNDN